MPSYRQTLEAQRPLTADQLTRKSHTKIRKSGGDDRHSWALFVMGREVYNGMDGREASWRKSRYIREGKL